MTTELVLATGNEHKARELAAMVPGVRIRTPRDLGIRFEYEETGSTYLENGMGKAMALYHQIAAAGSPRAVLADDSGLSVVALGGDPGVHSARYGAAETGEPLESSARNALLLRAMDGVTDRRAFYVCCMVLVFSEYRYVVAQETWDGVIAQEPSGSGGFGYDPVFLLHGEARTAAHLSESEKNTLSHRGKALQKILPHIRDIDC